MMLNMLSTLISKFTKFLRTALWNANGIQQHKKELEIFLQHNFIDIMLISETHFIDKSYFNIPKYLTIWRTEE
jgi:exonuclease III